MGKKVIPRPIGGKHKSDAHQAKELVSFTNELFENHHKPKLSSLRRIRDEFYNENNLPKLTDVNKQIYAIYKSLIADYKNSIDTCNTLNLQQNQRDALQVANKNYNICLRGAFIHGKDVIQNKLSIIQDNIKNNCYDNKKIEELNNNENEKVYDKDKEIKNLKNLYIEVIEYLDIIAKETSIDKKLEEELVAGISDLVDSLEDFVAILPKQELHDFYNQILPHFISANNYTIKNYKSVRTDLAVHQCRNIQLILNQIDSQIHSENLSKGQGVWQNSLLKNNINQLESLILDNNKVIIKSYFSVTEEHYKEQNSIKNNKNINNNNNNNNEANYQAKQPSLSLENYTLFFMHHIYCQSAKFLYGEWYNNGDYIKNDNECFEQIERFILKGANAIKEIKIRLGFGKEQYSSEIFNKYLQQFYQVEDLIETTKNDNIKTQYERLINFASKHFTNQTRQRDLQAEKILAEENLAHKNLSDQHTMIDDFNSQIENIKIYIEYNEFDQDNDDASYSNQIQNLVIEELKTQKIDSAQSANITDQDQLLSTPNTYEATVQILESDGFLLLSDNMNSDKAYLTDSQIESLPEQILEVETKVEAESSDSVEYLSEAKVNSTILTPKVVETDSIENLKDKKLNDLKNNLNYLNKLKEKEIGKESERDYIDSLKKIIKEFENLNKNLKKYKYNYKLINNSRNLCEIQEIEFQIYAGLAECNAALFKKNLTNLMTLTNTMLDYVNRITSGIPKLVLETKSINKTIKSKLYLMKCFTDGDIVPQNGEEQFSKAFQDLRDNLDQAFSLTRNRPHNYMMNEWKAKKHPYIYAVFKAIANLIEAFIGYSSTKKAYLRFIGHYGPRANNTCNSKLYSDETKMYYRLIKYCKITLVPVVIGLNNNQSRVKCGALYNDLRFDPKNKVSSNRRNNTTLNSNANSTYEKDDIELEPNQEEVKRPSIPFEYKSEEFPKLHEELPTKTKIEATPKIHISHNEKGAWQTVGPNVRHSNSTAWLGVKKTGANNTKPHLTAQSNSKAEERISYKKYNPNIRPIPKDKGCNNNIKPNSNLVSRSEDFEGKHYKNVSKQHLPDKKIQPIGSTQPQKFYNSSNFVKTEPKSTSDVSIKTEQPDSKAKQSVPSKQSYADAVKRKNSEKIETDAKTRTNSSESNNNDINQNNNDETRNLVKESKDTQTTTSTIVIENKQKSWADIVRNTKPKSVPETPNKEIEKPVTVPQIETNSSESNNNNVLEHANQETIQSKDIQEKNSNSVPNQNNLSTDKQEYKENETSNISQIPESTRINEKQTQTNNSLEQPTIKAKSWADEDDDDLSSLSIPWLTESDNHLNIDVASQGENNKDAEKNNQVTASSQENKPGLYSFFEQYNNSVQSDKAVEKNSKNITTSPVPSKKD